jgi:hypothetical protein
MRLMQVSMPSSSLLITGKKFEHQRWVGSRNIEACLPPFVIVSASAALPLDSNRRGRAMIEESEIRERAYALWEKDARPDGADCFYWYLARDQLETARQLSRGEIAHNADEEKVSSVAGYAFLGA